MRDVVPTHGGPSPAPGSFRCEARRPACRLRLIPPGTRRYSSRVDRRRAMLGTMSVQDLDETDWAPAGWEPQDVSALDDSPFGSVLSGSMIYDVSVLDPTPGWQPEDDVATEPAAPGDQNPTPPPPSRRTAAPATAAAHTAAARTSQRTAAGRTAAPATASRRTTVPQARRTASRLAAQRSTAPGGAVPGTSGRAPARPPGPRLAGAGGPPRLPGPASWGQTGVSGSPWAPPGTDPRLVTRAAQRPAAPQPYAPGAPSGAYGYGRGPGSGRGPSRVPGPRYGQAPAPQTRQAATWQPANRAAGTVGSPYALAQDHAVVRSRELVHGSVDRYRPGLPGHNAGRPELRRAGARRWPPVPAAWRAPGACAPDSG